MSDIATSNRTTQIVFSILFFFSLLPLWNRRKSLILVIKQEKFLILFLIWCFLSIFWSGFPIVSFKRLFQILVSITVPLGFFLFVPPNKRLPYFFYFLVAYIGLSFIAVIVVPGAHQPGAAAWRGFAPSKNHFGQATLLSALIFAAGLRQREWQVRILAVPFLVISLLLLLGSRSGTAWITGLFILGGAFGISVNRIFRRLRIGRVYLMFLGFIVVANMVALLIFAPDVMASLPGLIGKDPTFTGRTFLWSEIFRVAKTHLLIGCGYSGFWVTDNPTLLRLYEEFVWLPLQAHMGYLDILNEVGIVGFFLFILMIGHYFQTLPGKSRFYFGHWIILAVLLINFQETTLFRKNVVSGVLFIIAYLDLFSEFIHEGSERHGR